MSAYFRTWVGTKVNQRITDGGSDLAHAQNWWLTAVMSLVGAASVTVWGSCNSLAVVSGSSNLTTTGSFVWATEGTAHSWIVLQFANGGQLLFNFDNGSPLVTDVVWSYDGSFSGGSTTHAPTATHSSVINSLGQVIISGHSATDVLHIVWTTDGTQVWLVGTHGGQTQNVLAIFTLDDVVDPAIAGHDLAFAGYCQGGIALEQGDMIVSGFVDSVGAQLLTEHLQNNTGATPGGNVYHGNRRGMWSFGVYAFDASSPTTNENFLGRIRDVYTGFNESTLSGEIYQLPSGETWAKFENFELPWPSATPLDTGIATPVLTDVSAYLVTTQTAALPSITPTPDLHGIFIDMTCVYDDGSGPPAEGAPSDRRIPLSFRSGDDVVIRLALNDTAGGPAMPPTGSYLLLVARGPGPQARELVRAQAVPVGGRATFKISGLDTQAIPAQTGTWDLSILSTAAPTCAVVVPTSEFSLDSTYYPPMGRDEDDCGR